MKKSLLSSLLVASSMLISYTSFAQADEAYFREGFEEGAGLPTTSYTTPQTINGSSGVSFYSLGVYRTTGGTGACATQTGGPSHARFPNINATDSAFLVSPLVSRGVYRVRFLNGRASRRFSIFTTTDVSATTTNWTKVAFIPATNAACDQVDVIINDATARRVMIMSRAGTDSDIDSLVITSVSVFPVKFAGFGLASVAEGIKLNWTVATEQDVVQYEIERSSNGREFQVVGKQKSNGNSSSSVNYAWIDRSPITGVSYYRIKAVEKDGNVLYTNIAKSNTLTTKVEMTVAPNPVKNGMLNVQLSSLTKGTYELKLYNDLGQEVFNSQVSTTGGSLSQSFTLPSTVKAGMYNLQLSGGDVKISKRVVVQ